MDHSPLVYEGIVRVLVQRFPELWDRIEKEFGTYYDLKSEMPQAYPVFEGVLEKSVVEMLDAGTSDQSLRASAEIT